jgi:hypothetical protein
LIAHTFQVVSNVHGLVLSIWRQLFVQTFSNIRREQALRSFAENTGNVLSTISDDHEFLRQPQLPQHGEVRNGEINDESGHVDKRGDERS